MIAFKPPVKYGLIAGIGTVAYFLLFYFIRKPLLFNSLIYWLSLAIVLAMMWRALQAEQRAAERRLGLRAALRSAFLVFVIANGLYYLFYYLLYKLIDPGLIDLQRQSMRESLAHLGNLLTEGQRKEMLETIEGDKLAPTMGNTLLNFARSLIGGFALALGMAALWSRE